MKRNNKTKQSDTGCGSQCVCMELVRPDAQTRDCPKCGMKLVEKH